MYFSPADENLGFAFLLPAMAAVAKSGAAKKLLAKLKKKKKSAPAPAPAQVSAVKKAAGKIAALPKWVIPAAIGGVGLILVMTMAGGGGGGGSRGGVTVIK